jgi:two-component system alkaline phosphatase synthesis response regulator PhoP
LATVLAVDKDQLQLVVVTGLLKEEGHRVHTTTEPDRAYEVLQSELIDLVILEIALNRHDGMRVCQRIRQLNPYTPLMIVSERHEEEQIVRGLRVAADDYVVKPFSPGQFLARVHALLRRAGFNRGSRWGDDNLSIGEISLNLSQIHAVVNGHRVPLQPRQFSLLHALMDNSGRVLSRDQLMGLAWGDHYVGTAKSVDVCVHGLRKAIQPHLTGGTYIQALRGFGYKFEMPKPQAAGALP